MKELNVRIFMSQLAFLLVHLQNYEKDPTTPVTIIFKA